MQDPIGRRRKKSERFIPNVVKCVAQAFCLIFLRCKPA